MLYQLAEHRPTVSPADDWQGWVADNASVIGQVHLGQFVSVWFGAVIRGDTCNINIGDYSNVQDNAVLHTDAGIVLEIGQYVTVGHHAMLHGCTIGDNTLIGIGAIVLNRAVIGKNCIIGANALIPEGKVIPDNSVVMGSPGVVVKPTSDMAIQMTKLGAMHYANHCQQYKTQLMPYQLPK